MAGAISIVSEWSRKCLDLQGGSTANGNLLQIWDCNGLANQKWFFNPGSWRIQYAANPDKCIDALGGGKYGTSLGIWDCNGRSSQQWGYDAKMRTIYLASSADASLCMDLSGGQKDNGAEIQSWGCNGHTNQAWDISTRPPPSPASSSSVYIIRHGEKKWALGCLSDKGEARAKNLVNVFNGKAFAAPKYIFANWYHDPIDCERCKQTVTPLATSLGLQIDLTHGGGQPGTGPNGGNTGAASAIKAKLRSTGGPVVVAWEHVNIKYLAEDLGVSKNELPSWAGSDYDSIYVLEFGASQQLSRFWTAHENFTTGEDVVVV
jgi:hypothetical protein